MLDCQKALNELRSRKVTKGNEGADEAAREGSSRQLIGPEPFCGVAKPIASTAIKKWLDKESQNWWRKETGRPKNFLKVRLSLMEVEENHKCIFCRETEETAAHVLCD